MLKDAEVHMRTREIMKSIQREAEQLQDSIVYGNSRGVSQKLHTLNT
jgi:hypothetical protein